MFPAENRHGANRQPVIPSSTSPAGYALAPDILSTSQAHWGYRRAVRERHGDEGYRRAIGLTRSAQCKLFPYDRNMLSDGRESTLKQFGLIVRPSLVTARAIFRPDLFLDSMNLVPLIRNLDIVTTALALVPVGPMMPLRGSDAPTHPIPSNAPESLLSCAAFLVSHAYRHLVSATPLAVTGCRSDQAAISFRSVQILRFSFSSTARIASESSATTAWQST
jgi:hypothetical protein